MASDASVLIAGAGPSGLMLAVQLARLGVPLRIIDAGSGPTTQSRALVIHARSLEILAQLGVVKQFLSLGEPVRLVTYIVEGTPVQTVSFAGFGAGLTAFPHLLVLEQSQTERLLLELLAKLGRSVEWDSQLQSVRQNADVVTASLRSGAGSPDTVTTEWLVGADGARSRVRNSLGVPFRGSTYDQRLFVLDCALAWKQPPAGLGIAFGKDGFGAFFPMGGGRWRVVGIVPEQPGGDAEVTFEDVAARLPRRLRLEVSMTDPAWMALYRAHHRYAAAFRVGRCFLVGDAAHIHSPVGAQGMNTGLQDAYNLAWKLALVSSGRGRIQLLDTYQAERRPVARRLVRTTDRAFAVVASRNPLVRLAPLYVGPKLLPLAVRSGTASDFAFGAISQIGISYRSSPLSCAAPRRRFPPRAPRPGDRLPYVASGHAGKRVNIQELVTGRRFCLLVFAGKRGSALPSELAGVISAFKSVLDTCHVHRSAGNTALYAAFGIQATGYYLVRPDLHIACRSSDLAAEPLRAYLERWLTPSG